MPDFSEDVARRERLASLVAKGVDPYPPSAHRSHDVAVVLERFDDLHASHERVTIAGRALAIRHLGALTFVRVSDASGVMQIVVRKDGLGADAYALFVDHADVGDILEAAGEVFVTKTGERSLLASSVSMLAKALAPLPEKWHGLQDVEARYRQRELDLIANPEIARRFATRSRLVSAIRSFLDERGFLEVETPVLQPIPGGANARPFVTHHNALDADLYLRIAPELYLKRLLVGGFEKIYEVARCFRNEGIDYAHNPEFTMLECYAAYTSKDAFVGFMEDMLVFAVTKATGGTVLEGGERTVDFTAPWPHITFREAVLNASGIDIDTLTTPEEVIAAAKGAGLALDFSSCVGVGDMIDELWKKSARPGISSPTWVFDYPLSLKPLAREHPTDATKSASVQLVVHGAEIINAYYHELNDPVDQRRRFNEQQQLREKGSEEAQWMDEAFVGALEHGMPPASGMGMGIDRLVALVTDAPNLKEAILFPTLRPKKDV